MLKLTYAHRLALNAVHEGRAMFDMQRGFAIDGESVDEDDQWHMEDLWADDLIGIRPGIPVYLTDAGRDALNAARES